MKYLDLMLDLETLSLDSYAVIKQISAVPFDLATGKKTDLASFNVLINPITSAKIGAKIDGSTIEWWFKQDEAVIKQVFIHAMLEGIDIKIALQQFFDYVKGLKEEHNIKEVFLWGNGVKADNVWLENQYKLAGMKYPVSYREDADMRTMILLGKRFGIDLRDDIKFIGNKHNAIDDCNHQIEVVCQTFQAIKALIKEPS